MFAMLKKYPQRAIRFVPVSAHELPTGAGRYHTVWTAKSRCVRIPD
jgi:hypothetical protein